MDNIEKFQKLKKISALKAKLHKQELESFFSLDKYVKTDDVKYSQVFKTGYSLYRFIAPFIKQS